MDMRRVSCDEHAALSELIHHTHARSTAANAHQVESFGSFDPRSPVVGDIDKLSPGEVVPVTSKTQRLSNILVACENLVRIDIAGEHEPVFLGYLCRSDE